MNLQMTVTWCLATPLNIAGAVFENPLVDSPLLRQQTTDSRSADILLPASTIKGKLRGEAERLVGTFGLGGQLCSGRTAETMCPAYWWDRTSAPRDNHCLLCRLFGSPWQPSQLWFSDVTARDESVTRPGIGLSRVRGTAQEDLLFFVETTAPSVEAIKFSRGRIEGVVDDAGFVALLYLAVQQVSAFGNGRTRGRGWLQAKETLVEVDGVKWEQDRIADAWRAWINDRGRELVNE